MPAASVKRPARSGKLTSVSSIQPLSPWGYAMSLTMAGEDVQRQVRTGIQLEVEANISAVCHDVDLTVAGRVWSGKRALELD